MSSLFMGIDIGTSSVRAVLFDSKGNAVYAKATEYSLFGSGGIAELNPKEILDGMVFCIRECVEHKPQGSVVEGVSFSCQMHSLICVDHKGEPLTNVITWADTRAIPQAESITEVDLLYRISGCRVQHPMYPLSKIIWLRENQPETFNRTEKFLTIKEYIFFKLFGVYLVDYTLAASQALYDINKNKWSPELLTLAGISESKLSDVVPCDYVVKGLNTEMAKLMGIPKETPFVIGSGDGILANLGCGVSDDRALSSTIGTSGAIRTAVKSPLLDEQQRTWCYSFTDDTWVAGGAINSGGISLKFLRERLGAQLLKDTSMVEGQEYKAMDVLAERVPVGSEGLVFLPYLTGERSPDWNPRVRGLMAGLELYHGNGHICRAAMEGVVYRLYSVYEVMAAINSNAKEIRATGGYTKSRLWMQIQADMFNKDILVPGTQEGSALGAAFTAMVALGEVSDFNKQLEAMKPVSKIEPNEEVHNIYKKSYKRAMELYRDTLAWHK